jgi:RNA polymerase sigma factor (sigma-70 family)
VKDKFHALRQYKNKGKPFAGWFYILAHNKIKDYIRKKVRKPKVISNNPDNQTDDILETLPNPSPDSEIIADLSELLSITREALMKLSTYCQLLLQMAADEFTPREMVVVLRLAKDQNKKVSDDLRECRRKLIQVLANEGIDIKAYIKA